MSRFYVIRAGADLLGVEGSLPMWLIHVVDESDCSTRLWVRTSISFHMGLPQAAWASSQHGSWVLRIRSWETEESGSFTVVKDLT